MARHDLSEGEWRLIAPLLPNKPRGVARVDDRRVINGIFYVLRTGSPWRDLPERYGAYTTVYNRFNRLEPPGSVAADVRGANGAHGHLRRGDRRHPRQGAPLGGGRKRGAFLQAMGRSRGGRTTKVHGLVDERGKPRVLLLSAGNINDISMAHALIQAAGPFRRLLADRAYDADHLRQRLAQHGAEAVIPSTTSRKAPIPYNVQAYRQRNLVERMWCRLKDFRRIATRYDKLADNFLAMVQLASMRLWLRANESTA